MKRMRINLLAFLATVLMVGSSLSFAEGVSIEASSVYDGQYHALNAFDGDPKTR